MPTATGLVVAPARAPDGRARTRYIAGAVGSPVCASLAVVAGCAGLGYAGAIGAVVAVAAVCGFAVHAARYRRVTRYLEGQARGKANARREHLRLQQLRVVGLGRVEHYNELSVLVEQIERIDPALAARFELQGLLDHFIRAAVDHHRFSDALRLSGAGALPASLALAGPRSRRRRDLLQRRLAHRDACTQRMAELADEIDATDDLIRLVAQRVACPSQEPERDREIDRRLGELDEVDAALHQLSA